MVIPLEVELVPLGDSSVSSSSSDSANVDEYSCAFRSFERLVSAVLWNIEKAEIRRDAAERVFHAGFLGQADESPLADGMLSKKIPLEIARDSNCECGSSLELGSYSIISERNDFRFEAEYFCPACRIRLQASRSGIRAFIKKWLGGLEKIDVKASGIGLERSKEPTVRRCEGPHHAEVLRPK